MWTILGNVTTATLLFMVGGVVTIAARGEGTGSVELGRALAFALAVLVYTGTVAFTIWCAYCAWDRRARNGLRAEVIWTLGAVLAICAYPAVIEIYTVSLPTMFTWCLTAIFALGMGFLFVRWLVFIWYSFRHAWPSWFTGPRWQTFEAGSMFAFSLVSSTLWGVFIGVVLRRGGHV